MISSIPDLAVIATFFMVLFGAKNFPELGRNLGRVLREFKSGMSDLKDEIKSEPQPLEPLKPLEPTRHETVVSTPTSNGHETGTV